MSRYYLWNGQPVTAVEYAERMADLLARGLCIHAENCQHNQDSVEYADVKIVEE